MLGHSDAFFSAVRLIEGVFFLRETDLHHFLSSHIRFHLAEYRPNRGVSMVVPYKPSAVQEDRHGPGGHALQRTLARP